MSLTAMALLTNREGKGVKPDVEVSAPQALKTAYLAALNKILETVTDELSKASLKQAIATAQEMS